MRPFLHGPAAQQMRHRLYAGLLVAILLAVGLAVVQWVVLKMLPFDNKSEFQVILDMPEGTPVERTARVLDELSRVIETVPEVRDYQVYAGTASPINFNGLVRQYYLRSGPEQGDIQVNLVDKHERDRASHEIALDVRPRLAAIAQEARRITAGGGGAAGAAGAGADRGRDLRALLRRPSAPWRGSCAACSTRRRTSSTWTTPPRPPRVATSVTRRPAEGGAARRVPGRRGARADRRPPGPGRRLTCTKVWSGGRFPSGSSCRWRTRQNIDQVLELEVRSAAGRLVPLSEVTRVEQVPWDGAIYHKDLLPVVFVTGDMAGRLDSPLYGMFDLVGQVGDSLPSGARPDQLFISAPDDPNRFAIKWDGEWQITYETFRDMGLAYSVGLVLIYLLIVAQFRSYLMPLIIMAPIPLTIIGVMPGHALLGAQFTATSMIGMIALAGIIVRNSILLVDFIDAEIARGEPLEQAVVGAAAIRARPIVADRAGRDQRRLLHPRRPHLQRARGVADLRDTGLHPADSGGDPGLLLRLPQPAAGR